MAAVAWDARESAHVYGNTKVGCAVRSEDGRTFLGCNVEHRFRCHDIHAEVNAISSLVASGGVRIRAVVVVAKTERFTPCGGCMDWIMELGGPDCVVAFQGMPEGPLEVFSASELMPRYPRY
jgi:cytidine deaminase